MAVILQLTVPASTQDRFNELDALIGQSMRQAGGPPAGLMSHVVHPEEDGFVIAEVWRTEAEAQTFVDEVLRPLMTELELTAQETTVRQVWSFARPEAAHAGNPTRPGPRRGAVFAVIGVWDMDPDLIATQEERLRDHIVPGVRQAPGIVKGYWAQEPGTTRSHTNIVFENRAAAESFAEQVRGNTTAQDESGVSNASLVVVEVVAET
jgi:hypothetical protein